MTLLHHRRTAPRGTATTPMWSLTLPRFSAPPSVTSPPIAEPVRTRWRCAACGAALSSAAAAGEHAAAHEQSGARNGESR